MNSSRRCGLRIHFSPICLCFRHTKPLLCLCNKTSSNVSNIYNILHKYLTSHQLNKYFWSGWAMSKDSRVAQPGKHNTTYMHECTIHAVTLFKENWHMRHHYKSDFLTQRAKKNLIQTIHRRIINLCGYASAMHSTIWRAFSL